MPHWLLDNGDALLAAAVRMAAPLLLAALGELLVERVGIINVGIEGLMLVGALAGAVASYLSGSPWVGLLGGVMAGIALSSLFGWMAVYRGSDQVVLGTAVNILALGVTGVFLGAFRDRIDGPFVAPTFHDISLGPLARIPLLGAAFFDRNALVYLAFLLTPALGFLLYRTRLGLQMRAAGEYPLAVEAAGVDVLRLRFLTVLAGGALGACGGVYLSIGHNNTFVENMVSGRGFIALAVVIFGAWRPGGVLAAAMFFGLALGVQVLQGGQGTGAPHEEIWRALPYLATLLALVLRFGRNLGPAALATPYSRQ